MTAKRLRRAFFLFVFVVLLLVAAICWPHERLLLEQAHFVAAMDAWDEYRDHKKAAFGHNWLSDHELLFARQPTNTQGKWEYHYFVCDIQSGITTPAVKYQKALQLATPHYGVRFSPDRQWLYAQQSNGDGLEVVKRDGARQYSFKEKGYPLLWMSDKLYINAIMAEDYSDELGTEKDCMRLRSVADSRIIKDLPDIGGEIAPFHRICYCVDHFVLLSTDLNEVTHQVSVSVTKTGLGLNAYPTTKQVFVLPLPAQENIKDVDAKLSPDGTQVAYRCVQIGVSPILARLHRLFPPFNPKPHTTIALWVSNVDGKHLHEVGHIDRASMDSSLGDTDDYTDTFLDYEWLPSGRRLAFRYKERLYTVTAN